MTQDKGKELTFVLIDDMEVDCKAVSVERLKEIDSIVFPVVPDIASRGIDLDNWLREVREAKRLVDAAGANPFTART